MTHLVPFSPPEAPAVFIASPASWTFLTLLVTSSILLSLLFGAKAFCEFFWDAPKRPPAKVTQAGTSSASSKGRQPTTLPWSRFPREGVELATFVTRMEPSSPLVTRRPEIWRSQQLRGRECYLVLDCMTTTGSLTITAQHPSLTRRRRHPKRKNLEKHKRKPKPSRRRTQTSTSFRLHRHRKGPNPLPQVDLGGETCYLPR